MDGYDFLEAIRHQVLIGMSQEEVWGKDTTEVTDKAINKMSNTELVEQIGYALEKFLNKG